MGTMSEEILSRKLGREVRAGEIVIVPVDYVMAHDQTAPLAIESFRRLGMPLFDPQRTIIVFDHIIPAATVQAATLQRGIRNWMSEERVGNFLQEGICHQVLVERGFVTPGAVVVGADSHTCTYGALGAFGTGMGSTDIAVALATGKTWLRVPETIRFELSGQLGPHVYAKDLALAMCGAIGVDGANYHAVEYGGSAVRAMSISERMTLANMAIEMGGKTGLVEPDEVVDEYLAGRAREEYEPVLPRNPRYSRVVEIDASSLEPMVALPPDPEHLAPAHELQDLPIDQVFIGTCTNGRLDDLEIAASVLRGHTISPRTRMVVTPASRQVLLSAMERGYIQTLVEAGATVTNPGCGPCIGRHQGVLAAGERAVTTQNRNFPGRMGDPTAEIYLASPATAAASAITGYITDPRRLS